MGGSLRGQGRLAKVPPVLAPAVESKARLLLLDSLGCILAGLRAPKLAALNRALAVAFPGDLALPGMAAPLAPAGLAALAATAMCADEACEGLAEAHGRPALPVVPVVLALGAGRGMAEVLAAVVAGYEAGARAGIAWRVRPGMHVDGSWHALGAAVAAARLLGLDPARAAAAAHHAACQVPFSLYLPIARGMDGRNLYPAHAALLGVLCAAGEAAGFAAPPDALDEARRLALGLDAPAALPDRALILDAYLKPFAAVRHVHYAAAAALQLRPRLRGPITAIRLGTYAEAMRYCGNRAPASTIAAQFSLSFGTAAALLLGDLGPEAYRRLEDANLMRLEALVEVAEDGSIAGRGAVLSVVAGGVEHMARVESVAGDPAQPMTEAEVVAKFLRYAGAGHAPMVERVLRGEGVLPWSNARHPHPVPLPEGEGTPGGGFRTVPSPSGRGTG
jgi:2-methylcitrate dehydratase PrpD